jgi:carbonic anhydrase
MHFTRITLLATALTSLVLAEEWSYDEDTDWKHLGECAGSMQSPIDILNDEIALDHKHGDDGIGCISPVRFEGGRAREYYMKNNGHGFAVTPTDSSSNAMTVKGGILPFAKTFKFYSTHFHWGADDDEGSEHRLNNEQFPLEMHSIFYDSDAADVAEAVQWSAEGGAADTGGYRLAVFGLFFDVSSEDNPLLEAMLERIGEIENKDDRAEGLTIALSDWLKDDYFADYHAYLGSLTTPDCNEIIRWHMSKTIMEVSESQLALIRSTLHRGSGEVLDHNWRKPQANSNPRWSMCSNWAVSGNGDVCTVDLRAQTWTATAKKCWKMWFRTMLGKKVSYKRMCQCV